MNVATFVQALASFSWLLVVGAIGFAVFLAARQKKIGLAVGLTVGSVVLAGALTSVSAGLVFVQPTDRGVVVSAIADGGIREDVLGSGLHWVTPFFENVVTYPISRQTYTMSGTVNEGSVVGDDSIASRTADGQLVFIDASVIFSIDETKVVNFHIQWGNRYLNDLVRPIVRGVLRDIPSQYGVEEIYTIRRDEMNAAITERLREQFTNNGLILEEFVLRNITFTDEYAQSIELKQVAEQEVQRAVFVVEQRLQEAEQARAVAQGQADAAVIAAQGAAESRLINANAEAEALRLIAAALGENPDLLEYTYVQNLSDQIQIMLVPANSPYLFSLPELPSTAPITTLPNTTITPEPTPEATTTP